MPHATHHPPPPGEDEAMNASLQEALSCTTCAITHIPKKIFHQDRIKGIYNASRDPPFLIPGLTTTTEDREIPPDEIPSDQTDVKEEEGRPTVNYTHLLTPTQKQAYNTQIQIYLSHDPTDDYPFAKYRVDYHIHVHYLLRRSMLGLCRDLPDVYEMKDWKKRLHDIDNGLSHVVAATSIDTTQPQLAPSQNNYSLRSKNNDAKYDRADGLNRKRYNRHQTYQQLQLQPQPQQQQQKQYTPRSSRSSLSSSLSSARGDWVGDSNLQMLYQLDLWRKGAKTRQKRLEDCRIRWAAILEERRRQRAKLLRSQRNVHGVTSNSSMLVKGVGGGVSAVKVRLYCSTQTAAGVASGGEYTTGRRFLREVEFEEMPAFGDIVR
ncbi:hypothetical protein ASPBRDRAFT_42147 [Aspergillus brasiliensis CBS 101740]|uniref:Uncharacterized protein n=1 Tax=Aspergillus brasiliensis (strain CBS 101740 / IMI 381727 / IBT 21946) TaxID=767769 RepID=A0A1L9UL48_ASPBC|nr:hypothetical protein ASPBRDRAFT_42147 [Aspergillus brasiliensis CBS 101740]